MSWDSKTDYCGLASEGKIKVKSSTENRSGQYLEKLGQNGEIVATKAFGETASPSNDYVLVSDVSFSGLNAISLGKIVTVGTEKFCLQSISVKTSAGGEPTLSANAVQVESGATDAGAVTFDVPTFTVSKDEVAQLLFSAFTVGGETNELVECGAEISCSVGTHTVNGVVVASSASAGKIVVTATIGQYGTDAPTVTVSSGWEVSSPLTCSDPDSDFQTWTVSLSKPLSKSTS